jgi:hypothetical protein
VLRLVYALLVVHTHDRYYALQQLGLWSLAEATIYILCGVMPLLPKFIQMVRHRKGHRTYDPTPNSVHRSARFLQRRFTNNTDPNQKFQASSDPWMRPDEMTMKLTGMSAKGKSARHFNGRDAPPYRTLSSTDVVGMGEIREDEEELRRGAVGYRDSMEEPRPEEGGEANFWLGTGIMKTVRIETNIQEAVDTPDERDQSTEPWGKR